MTREELIALACRTADSLTDNKGRLEFVFDDAGLERFAEVVAAAAPRRPWVGLEAEEILDLFDKNNVYGSKWIEFARTVEAKLKERNHE